MEQVVLLSDDLTAIGVEDKATVHHEHTPLHLAFSCYLLDARGRVLLTRRALSKVTWPGVWTNSFCGHPAPEETFHEAIRRRAREELGCEVADIRLVDAAFRYAAIDASGIVENEWCPVYIARLDCTLDPQPDEVMDITWVEPSALTAMVHGAPATLSPWSVLQWPLVAPIAGGSA